MNMNHKPIPTLQMFAMMKIAAVLQRDHEIRELSRFERYEAQTSKWSKLIDSKIQQLRLPSRIQKRMSVVTSRVCLWIVQLCRVHHQVSVIFGVQCNCLDGLSPTSFLWSTEGLLDGQETVQRLVRDQKRDVAFRFTLAFEFSLVKDLLEMCRQMDHATKRSFGSKVTPYDFKSIVDELDSHGTVTGIDKRIFYADELPSLSILLQMLTGKRNWMKKFMHMSFSLNG